MEPFDVPGAGPFKKENGPSQDPEKRATVPCEKKRINEPQLADMGLSLVLVLEFGPLLERTTPHNPPYIFIDQEFGVHPGSTLNTADAPSVPIGSCPAVSQICSLIFLPGPRELGTRSSRRRRR